MKNKNETKIILKLSIVAISLLLMIGCSPDATPSLYSTVGDKGNPAVITSALSSSGVSVGTSTGYAGITKVTISGSSFANNVDDNYVYFGAAKAEVLSASETELIVEAPIIYGDSLQLKIAKPKVENYSNTVLYKLTSAVNNYYPFIGNQEPYSVTSDAVGNIYFSFIEAAKGVGVYKISPDGLLSEFAPKGGETTFNDLKYHSDGYLVGVYGNKAIFKIEEGTKPKVLANTGVNSIKLFTFDFDSDTTIWAAGKGGNIVAIKTDNSFKLFDFEPNIKGVKVFDNYLYAIAGEDNAQNIVRFPIVSSDSLGAVETYFAFSSNAGIGVIANSITFSAVGDMYIATSPLTTVGDPIDPIMIVYKDGSFGTWYKNLINSSASSFSWSTGNDMFVVTDRYPADRASNATFPQTILKIDMEREGAPEFGRD